VEGDAGAVHEEGDTATDAVAEYRKNGKTIPIPRGNDDPLYRPGLLLIPIAGHDITDAPDDQPRFPPTSWAESAGGWPWWRSTLWHEVCHQYQDQVLGRWNPLDGYHGHRDGWDDAMVAVARAFDLQQTEFEDFVDAIWGKAEGRPYGWSCPRL